MGQLPDSARCSCCSAYARHVPLALVHTTGHYPWRSYAYLCPPCLAQHEARPRPSYGTRLDWTIEDQRLEDSGL